MTANVDVLIVGAGPTGLTLAAVLGMYPIKTRLVETSAGPTSLSKALGVHARTLEYFEQFGLAEAAIERGQVIRQIRLHSGGTLLVDPKFPDLETRYPFALMLEQSATEELLDGLAKQRQVPAERNTSLTEIFPEPDHVRATLRHPDGSEESVTASYLVGCDGAHSVVRHQLDLPFEGARYPVDFALMDAHIEWPFSHENLNVFFGTSGLVAAFPIRHERPGRYRLVVQLPYSTMSLNKVSTDPAVDHGPELKGDSPGPTIAEMTDILEDVTQRKVAISHVAWAAYFRVHHRMVPQFRLGRVFVAGDAAHIHSPVGGRGMNYGIQDAINLGWKLGAVVAGHARPELLDTYDAERRPLASTLLNRVDAATQLATATNPLARGLRNLLGRTLLRTRLVQRQVFLNLSELAIHYRRSPLSWEAHGEAASRSRPGRGRVRSEKGERELRAGDRLPPCPVTASTEGGDSQPTPTHLQSFVGLDHWTLFTLHGANPPDPALVEAAAGAAKFYSQWQGQTGKSGRIDWIAILQATQLPSSTENGPRIVLDPDGTTHERLGANDTPALFLVRPDGYIGLHAHRIQWSDVEEYLANNLGTPQAGEQSAR